MIETVPSTADSTPYFNPATQRFHDPVTKRFTKAPPIGPQSVMDPEVMKPMQGPTAPDAQTGLVLNSLNSMKDSLKELVTLTKKSLGIEEKEFAADKFESAREGLEGADLDAGDTDTPPDDTKKGGFLEGIKGAFGKLMRPNLGTKGKLLLLAAGLYGLTKFSETIVKTLAPMLEWLDKTITTFQEQGFEAGMKGLKDDFIDLIVNPSLGMLGLTYDRENGDIDRLPGSWLDVLDPISGETNVFDTVMDSIIDTFNLLAAGRWPDGTKEGKKIFPDWMYGMVLPEEPYFLSAKEEGFWTSFFNLLQFKKPDGTQIFAFLQSDSQFWKDLSEGTDTFIKDFKKDMFGLMSTDWFDEVDTFMKNDFRTFMQNLVPSKETLDKLLIGPDGSTFSERVKKDIDLMMERFGDIAKFFYDEETGAVFGLDIQKMKDMLPTLQEMVDSIISSLPKFMRPNTIMEQIEDKQEEIGDVKKRMDKFDRGENAYYGRDTQEKRDEDQLLFENLNKELNDLKSLVFGYEVNPISITGTSNRQNIETFNEMGIKTKNLKDAAEANAGFNMSGMYSSAYSNVAPPVVASNVNQGDTIVGTSNHINLEKSVNHGDFTSILTFNEGAYLAAGGQRNN